MAEMALAGERDDEFKLLDHAMGLPGGCLPFSQERAASAIARLSRGGRLCDNP
jgi:hypothetical protein